MKPWSDLSKKFREIKVVSMILITVLAIVMFILMLTTGEIVETMLSNPPFLIFCILAWITLILAFSSYLLDFIAVKRHSDITTNLDELAFLDKLTGLPNRFSVDRMSEKYDTREKMIHLGCILVTISNLKEINDNRGREGGDRVISDFCTILESVGHKYGMVGRNSGNEFLILIEDCDRNRIELFLGDLQRRIHNHNTLAPDYPIVASYNSILSDDIMAEHFYSLITHVYKTYETNMQTLY